MEVYILDSLLRREEVVDQFESLIWTERHKAIGEFQLLLNSSSANRRLFTTGKRIVHNESVRVMTVETVEDTTDDNGKKQLRVRGRSLESILEDRVALNPIGFSGDQKWSIGGTPEEVARQMFFSICVEGSVSPYDVIPFLGGGVFLPADNIPESNFEIIWYQEPASLYSAIKDLCDIYDLGFRLVRNPDNNLLQFNIYTGSDRTNRQTTLTPVVFSPELENLENTTEFTTIEETKNCAYVFTTVTTQVDDGNGGTESVDTHYYEIVYPPDVDPETEGFDRRVLPLGVTLEEDEQLDIPGSLQKRGLDELAKHRAFTAFDGEVNQFTNYRYGVDYHLGDLVTMQNADGYANSMRVTEQIFVSDLQGDRSYPTLTVNKFIQPGSWESWGYEVWEDLGPETWAEQP